MLADILPNLTSMAVPLRSGNVACDQRHHVQSPNHINPSSLGPYVQLNVEELLEVDRSSKIFSIPRTASMYMRMQLSCYLRPLGIFLAVSIHSEREIT